MIAWAAACLALALAACQKGPAEERPQALPGAAPSTDAGQTLYSYVDEAGRIRMATSLVAIPERFRDQVVVQDLGRSRASRLSDDRLVVIDARVQAEGKPLNYSVVDLRALAKAEAPTEKAADPGALGREVAGRGIQALRTALGFGSARPEVSVILYSAEWCGFCKKAGAYLRQRGVAFEERDIERDRAAAAELDRKLSRAQKRGAGIPVLDIGGKLVIGFDRARIDQLLGL